MGGGSRTTSRSASQTIREEAKAQRVKRTHYRDAIIRIQRKIDDDDVFKTWTKGQLKEYVNKIRDSQANLDETIINITCEEEEADQELLEENNRLDDEIMRIKAKISDRLDEMEKANRGANHDEDVTRKNFTIEVQATDAAGNIPNTWGTFDGDYAKWQSFRDRWLSTMHNNDKVKTIVKFQNLKTACIDGSVGFDRCQLC